MVAKKAGLTAIAVALLWIGAPALAQTSDRLIERYSGFAGSEANAKALVAGLRDGGLIKLSTGNTITTFDPPTQKMGYGNIDNALSLAEASLQKQGITNPTPEQLKSSLTAVLQQRADGKGWGEIAHSLGSTLGELKRAERPEQSRAEKPQRPERPERPERHYPGR